MPSQRTQSSTSSFRDPAGYVFEQGGEIHRAVTSQGVADYRHFIESGLYDELLADRAILPHDEVDPAIAGNPDVSLVMKTHKLPFFSYPYEWSFPQYRDAAILTLGIMQRALAKGMILKDASAFNISFLGASPVFIDILSFTRYDGRQPWAAYLQFCEHYLAPLLISDYTGTTVFPLLRNWIDGIPLAFAASALPIRSRLRFQELLHIHLHAAGVRRYSKSASEDRSNARTTNVAALVDGLLRLVKKLPRRVVRSDWSSYYDETVYSTEEENRKERFVQNAIKRVSPLSVWDLGSNTGKYARAASAAGIATVAMDADAAVVGRLYERAHRDNETQFHSLVMNVANPSPRLGWAHSERVSLEDRGPADLVLYLGLVHHLRFPHTIPLAEQLGFLSRISRYSVFEWVPPEDINVRRMVTGTVREQLPYSEELLRREIETHFSIEQEEVLGTTGRVLFLLRNLQTQ